MKKAILYSSFFILTSSFSFGQVKFTSIPMDSALVPRNLNTNLGTLNVQGTVNNATTPYDSICIKIYRDLIPVDSIYQNLNYSGGISPFNFSLQIPAELHEYRVSVYGIKKAIQTLDTTIKGLLAGDVFIIDGQSNAFALERVGSSDSINKSEFIRAFGNADSSTAGLMPYLRWFMAEGDGGLTENGHVGQWGLRFGRLLVDNIKIPVAIMNGACGGTPISYYERTANYKTDSNSNYGRLYYRMTLAGLKNNVRAIFWSQGETDGLHGTPTSEWVTEFDTLEHSFRQDYPGFEKTYIFQTKTENVYPELGIMAIEEAQRQVTIEHDTDIEIMSTAALKSDAGGLHFEYIGGYEIFGNRLYNLVARDLYEISSTLEIDAPMITGAYLRDSTTLVIKEKADSLLQHKPGDVLANYEIENAPGVTIDTILLDKSNIILRLSKYPGNNATVSYLAQLQDTGNWVTNTNGIELVCFYEYPVATDSTTGIPNYVTNSSFLIYPNPFNSTATVLLSTEGTYSLEVDDITGRKLQQVEFTGKQYELSAESLAKGIYFIRIFDKKYTLVGTTKAVVQ